MGQSKDERIMSLLDSFLEGRGESADSVAELGTVPMDYAKEIPDRKESVKT